MRLNHGRDCFRAFAGSVTASPSHASRARLAGRVGDGPVRVLVDRGQGSALLDGPIPALVDGRRDTALVDGPVRSLADRLMRVVVDSRRDSARCLCSDAVLVADVFGWDVSAPVNKNNHDEYTFPVQG
jgi:hypothetical protein